MTLTITASVGSASANSFVTEAEQIDYVATRLNASEWTTVSGSECTEDEKKAMISATRTLSAQKWIGRRTDDTQALSWPRWDVPDPHSPNGFVVESDVVPQDIKNATMELAFQYINMGTTDLNALPNYAGVIEKTVDVITTRWEGAHSQRVGLDRFPLVMDWIRPYLAGRGVVDVVRG